MGRTAIIGSALAALTLGSLAGLGAQAAQALSEDRACSEIAGFTVCALAEHADGSGSTLAGLSWSGADILTVGQSVENGNSTSAFLFLGPAGVGASQRDTGDVRFLAVGAGVVTGENNAMGAGVLLSSDDDSQSDYGFVRAGSYDGQFHNYAGVEWDDDICQVFIGSAPVADCPTQTSTPALPLIPYVNLY